MEVISSLILGCKKLLCSTYKLGKNELEILHKKAITECFGKEVLSGLMLVGKNLLWGTYTLCKHELEILHKTLLKYKFLFLTTIYATYIAD